MDSLPALGIPQSDITVWQDHKELFRYGTGIECPPDPDGLFFLYSCTKVLTCAAALTLFERGKFLLNTKVSDILPEFADVRVMAGGGAYTVPAEKPILMRDLFMMTSGIGYNLTSGEIRAVREATGGRCPTRDAVRAMAQMPFTNQPGSKFLYGLSHDILAAAVEVMADMRFSDYLRKAILDPLEMSRTTFRASPEVQAKMVKQYRFNDKTGVADPMPLTNMYVLGSEYDSGGAGAISCVSDMIKFCDAMAMGGTGKNGARILSPLTVDLMRTPMLNEQQRATFNWANLCSCYSYGLGVRVHVSKEGGIILPDGEFGWGGAAGALMIICPELHLSAYYAQHMLNNKEEYVHPRLFNIIASSL